MVLDPFS